MKYYLYILETIDHTLYTGIATNVLERFEKHKKGIGAKYTKSHPPQKLVYVDIFEDKSSASKEEYRIKKTLTKAQKEKLIFENSDKTQKIINSLAKKN